MKSSLKFVILSVLLSNYLFSDNLKLNKIEVIEQNFKEKDKAFVKSGASSIRDEINKSDKDLDTIIRSVPGAFTQMDKSSGAVSVNIRGGSGFGKVNTMVDGVTQTFYSSGGDIGGKNSGTSQFGATIDTSFISNIEVERGSFRGASGTNALMGSANFKTLSTNDILRSDKNLGAMIKGVVGSNETGPEIMGAAAGRVNFDSGYFGVLYGYSVKNISQDYDIGGGKTNYQNAKELTKDVLERNLEYCNSWDDECIDGVLYQYDTSPYDPSRVRQRPQSQMAKIEYGDDYNLLELQFRNNFNHLAGREIDTKTFQINHNFTLPDSNLVDLNFIYSKNINKQSYDKGSRIISRAVKEDLKGRNDAHIFDLSNTFKFELPLDISLATTIGYNRLYNRYSKNRYPKELRMFKDCDLDECVDDEDVIEDWNSGGQWNNIGTLKNSLPTNTFFPGGMQKFSSIYIDNRLEWDILTFDYNINFVKYKFRGEKLKNIDQYSKYIENLLNQARARGDYEATNKYSDILDDLKEKYYDEDYEDWSDLSATFPFYESGSGKFVNYSSLLSANFSDYFTPFIGYSKTHRAPNLKEMFFSNLGDTGVNTKLKPEVAKTWQLGFNGYKEGVFSQKDKIGYKLTTYKTKIENFIYNISENSGVIVRGFHINGFPIRHRNYDKIVKLKGYELEFMYDMGNFFTTLSYARQKTNQPASYSDRSVQSGNATEDQLHAQTFGLSKISLLPKSYGQVEVGTRFFNEKVTIGAIGKFFGKSKRTSWKEQKLCRYGYKQDDPDTCAPSPTGRTNGNEVGFLAQYEEIKSQPLVFDLYVAYRPSENFMMKFALDNITDKKYINPLDANNDGASTYYPDTDENGYFKMFNVFNNYARGRTAKFSFIYKF